MGEVGQSYDPGEPFDAMADSFRTQVAMMAVKAGEAAIFRDMSQQQQLEAFICGVMTGLMGVAFAYISDEGRASLSEAIREYVDVAAGNATDIEKNGRSALEASHDR